MYNTDKEKDLLNEYEKLFKDIKNEKLNILEIGVYKGGSIAWAEKFFKNANIYGIDKDLSQVTEKIKRAKLIEADQNDKEVLEKIAKNGLDIVIDDGSHYAKETKITFDILWRFTKHYIIEDWDAGLISQIQPKWIGLENVVFDICRNRTKLGVKRSLIFKHIKSYAYYENINYS